MKKPLISLMSLYFLCSISTGYAADVVVDYNTTLLHSVVTLTNGRPIPYAASGVLVNNKDYGFWRSPMDGHKTSIYFYWKTAAGNTLPADFTIGEIANIEYYTRKRSMNDDVNWYLTIYTLPDGTSDCITNWYCRRLQAEPMYSDQYTMNANEWTRFSTQGEGNGDNRFSFHDTSANTHIGFYGGPSWSDLQNSNFSWANYANSGSTQAIDYQEQTVYGIALETGSGWASNFDGDLDAVKFTMTNGDTYTFDLNADRTEHLFGCATHAFMDQYVWGPYEQGLSNALGFNIEFTPQMSNSGGSTDTGPDYGYWTGEIDTQYDKVDIILYFRDDVNGGAGQFREDDFTIGDILSIEYVTRKGDISDTTNAFLSLYTYRDNTQSDCTSDPNSWYCSRIQAWPEDSDQYTISANTWTTFSTEYDRDGNNQLRFTDTNAGTHMDLPPNANGPSWADITDPTFTWNDFDSALVTSGTGTAVNYSDDIVKAIYLSLGSGWTGTHTIDIDGVRITFNDGSTAYFDLAEAAESTPVLGATQAVQSNNDVDQCSAVVSLDSPGASNVCAGTTGQFTQAVAVDQNDGTQINLAIDNNSKANGTLPVGDYVVTWTYTSDDVGPNASQTTTQNVTIIDNQVPTITAPQDLNVNTDAGICTASIANLGVPTVSDNCSFQYSHDANASFSLGGTQVTWTITDDAGLIANDTQNVTVSDNEAPTLTSIANATYSNDAGSCDAVVSFNAPVASDNCDAVTASNDYNNTSDASDTYSVGSTLVQWSVTDLSGHTTTMQHTVTVNDDEAPVLQVLSDSTHANDAGVCTTAVTIAVPTVTDNCDAVTASNDYNSTSNASDTYPVGQTVVTWSSSDTSNNLVQMTHTVTVNDQEAPQITVGNDVTQSNDAGACGAQINGLTANVSDNCPGVVVTHTINNQTTTSSDASGFYDVGSTQISWRVTDAAGTFQTRTQTISISDDEAPTLGALNNVTVDANGALCGAQVNLTVPGVTDNCAVDTNSLNNTQNQSNDASGYYSILEQVNQQTVSFADQTSQGTMTRDFTITWDVSDIHGNTANSLSMTLTLSADDVDADSFCDGEDNCVNAYNPSQSDVDSDQEGNACDCGDGYIYDANEIQFNNADSTITTIANNNFTAADANEQSVNQYSESCDDGNSDLTDGCLNDCQVGPTISWKSINGGSFTIGNSSSSDTTERYTTNVNVANFELAEHEITVGQYKLCVLAGVCTAPYSETSTTEGCNWNVAGYDHHPVNCLAWRQAVDFATWLGVSLPTEAQWEYAATAEGDGRTYVWGEDTPDCTQTHTGIEQITTTTTTSRRSRRGRRGRRSRSVSTRSITYGCSTNTTAEVCTSPDLSPQGICDLSGNVSEWVADVYSRTHRSIPSDGSARSGNRRAQRYRVVKGGSWRDGQNDSRSTKRKSEVSGRSIGNDYLGFRVAR